MARKKAVRARLFYFFSVYEFRNGGYVKLTLTIYEHIGAFAICAQENRILVYFCFRQSWPLIHRFQQRVRNAICEPHKLNCILGLVPVRPQCEYEMESRIM